MTNDLCDAIDAAMRRAGPYGEVVLVLDSGGRVDFIEEHVSRKFKDQRQTELAMEAGG